MSSIFDALKKLEDEKSPQKTAKAGGDIFQPPQGGEGGSGELPEGSSFS